MGRRKETTKILKESLSDAFLELLQETPLEKIRMQDVADKAGVGRVTFYRHFSSKQELIEYKLQALWDRYNDEHNLSELPNEAFEEKWFFDFFYENRSLLKQLYDQGMFSYTHDFMINIFSPTVEIPEDSRFTVSFLVYGLLGIITAWAADGFKESTEEMIALFRKYNRTEIY